MSKPRLSELIIQVEGYANNLVNSVKILDERRYILEPLVNCEEIKTALSHKLKGTFGSRAYNHLVPLLSQDLVRDISRVFLDEARRSGSLINLYRKCEDRRVYEKLKDNFRSIPDRWHENPKIPGLPKEIAKEVIHDWRNQDRNDFESSFNEGWDSVSCAIDQIKSDAVAVKIKTFRDKYHAHLEMTPLGHEPGPFDVGSLDLTINNLFEFVDRYTSPAFELVRLITGCVHDVESFSEIHKKYGLDMWSILSGANNDSESS
ncbi:hypothetical protein SAMN04487965_1332 [Microbulbifer donghaiensis]|uniref:HEPN AbiU2-like domain-containing protein n=1 Tax=Microbulbifer donghaiensis TaxID=494016 RepID=A0A1M4YSL4_9GAMM|nr:hypothetical protein [Microbulbifer donghaiensis]SHF08607.1 hypothetical protein SAMN04487965_1332 [Microbulbifer donghaiensis]